MCLQYVFQNNSHVAVSAPFSDFSSIPLWGFLLSRQRPIATKCRNAFPFHINFKKAPEKGMRETVLFFRVKIMGLLLRKVAWLEAKEISLWKKMKSKALKYIFHSNCKDWNFSEYEEPLSWNLDLRHEEHIIDSVHVTELFPSLMKVHYGSLHILLNKANSFCPSRSISFSSPSVRPAISSVNSASSGGSQQQKGFGRLERRRVSVVRWSVFAVQC